MAGKFFLQLVLSVLTVVLLCGCGENEKTLDGIQKKASDLWKSSDDVLKQIPTEEAEREFRKLRQYEYRVVTLELDTPTADLEKSLTALGSEGWDCFHLERRSSLEGKIELLAFLKRRPDTLLKYVPQTILGRP